MRPARPLRSAIVLKSSTIMALHRALVKRKYPLLFSPQQQLIAAIGRQWRQRTTLYHDADPANVARAVCAAPLTPVHNSAIGRSSARALA